MWELAKMRDSPRRGGKKRVEGKKRVSFRDRKWKFEVFSLQNQKIAT